MATKYYAVMFCPLLLHGTPERQRQRNNHLYSWNSIAEIQHVIAGLSPLNILTLGVYNNYRLLMTSLDQLPQPDPVDDASVLVH